MAKNNKLNAKSKKFCEAYIKTGNASEAAKAAGYSAKTARQIGSKLLTKVDVQLYIEELMNNLKKDAIADADEVLQLLTKVARGEMQDENVLMDNQGRIVKVNTACKTKDQVKALELLGKRYKLYTDKVEAQVDVAATVIFEGEDEILD